MQKGRQSCRPFEYQCHQRLMRSGAMLEARAFGSGNKGMACVFDAIKTVHCRADTRQSSLSRSILNRPLLTQPILRLFDCREFLDVTIGSDDEVKGLPPINFYHVDNVGIGCSLFKGSSHFSSCKLSAAARRKCLRMI